MQTKNINDLSDNAVDVMTGVCFRFLSSVLLRVVSETKFMLYVLTVGK